MIAVCGPTGHIGSSVLRLATADGLEARGVYEPGSLPAPAPADRTLTGVEAAFEDVGSLRTAFGGVDVVVLVTPPDPRQVWWQRNIIDAARAVGVAKVVKISAYASRRDSPTNMGRWHYDGELALQASGLRYVILRPQYFMDNVLRPIPGTDPRVLLSVVPPGHRIGMIDSRDVAAVAFGAALSERWDGQTLMPTGGNAVGLDEVARSISKRLGSPVRYDFYDHERAARELDHAEVPRWRIADMLAITSDCGPETNSTVADVTGRRPYTLPQFVDHHAKVFLERFATRRAGTTLHTPGRSAPPTPSQP